MVLFWCRTWGSSARAISLAFDLTASKMCGWLRFGQRALLHSPQCHPAAIVQSPDDQDIKQCVEAVAVKCLLFGEEQVWAAADGLKLPLLQQSSHWLEQNTSHNGWLSHTCVKSGFVFAPDGLIMRATVDGPGSWHDSTQADCGVCSELEHIHDLHGARVWLSTQHLVCNPMISSSSQDKNLQFSRTKQQESRMQGLCHRTDKQHP